MKDFRYTEVATITIKREVLLQADDNVDALDICNEIMLNNFNPETDEVIGYTTEEWEIQEVKDGTNE
jgi:hypothetical protein